MIPVVPMQIERFATSKQVSSLGKEKALRGADGYIRKDAGIRDLFRRSISYFAAVEVSRWLTLSVETKLNRGSVIDFLNQRNEKKGNGVRYSRGFLDFIGGTDRQTLQEAFRAAMDEIKECEKKEAEEKDAQKLKEEKEKRAQELKAAAEEKAAREKEYKEAMQKKAEEKEKKKAEKDKGFPLPESEEGQLFRNRERPNTPLAGATKSLKYAETGLDWDKSLVCMVATGPQEVERSKKEAAILRKLKIEGCPGIIKYYERKRLQEEQTDKNAVIFRPVSR